MLAAVIAIGGSAFSFRVADSIARGDARTSKESFKSSSAEIAGTLRLALQREEDLLVDTRAYFARHPKASTEEFTQFCSDLDVSARYPEFLVVNDVMAVPKAELAAFTAARNAFMAELTGGKAPTFAVTPPGDRPEYCLGGVGILSSAKAAQALLSVNPLLDSCAQNGPILRAVRDSGRTSAVSFDAGTGETLGVQAAVYRPGADISTVAARNQAFLGWVVVAFDPKVVLDHALVGHPNTALEMRFRSRVKAATFADGSAPARSQTATVNLGFGWTVKTRGPVARAGLLRDDRARNLLLPGTFVAWLLGLLVFVLATGRRRAVGLVAQRTTELEATMTSLAASERGKGKLLQGLVTASEKERSWIAAELHDGPIQRLAALGFALDRAASKLRRGQDQGLDLLDASRCELTDVIGGVRRLMTELRPPALDESGLAGALRDYATRFTSETKIACDLTIDEGTADARVGKELETIIYRVAQEALTNVRKHANAANVEISVKLRRGRVILAIGDDGVGFDTRHQAHFLDTDHYGLRAMAERVENAGGDWTIKSAAGRGTVIRASLPAELRPALALAG